MTHDPGVCEAREAVDKLCLICQGAMLTEGSVMGLPCGHFFHTECIRMLRAKTEEKAKPVCPSCRLELHAPPKELAIRASGLQTRAVVITAAPLLKLKFVEKAEAFLRLALSEEPELAAAHNDLGYLLMVHNQDFDAAEKHYRRAIEIDPADTEGFLNHNKEGMERRLRTKNKRGLENLARLTPNKGGMEKIIQGENKGGWEKMIRTKR